MCAHDDLLHFLHRCRAACWLMQHGANLYCLSAVVRLCKICSDRHRSEAYAHRHERPASKPNPHMKITPEKSASHCTSCYARKQPLCTCVCACVLLRQTVLRHMQPWQQEQRTKHLWFSHFRSSLWSIPVNPGPCLPPRLSLHPSLVSALLPSHFIAAAMGLDLQEIKNLC